MTIILIRKIERNRPNLRKYIDSYALHKLHEIYFLQELNHNKIFWSLDQEEHKTIKDLPIYIVNDTIKKSLLYDP